MFLRARFNQNLLRYQKQMLRLPAVHQTYFPMSFSTMYKNQAISNAYNPSQVPEKLMKDSYINQVNSDIEDDFG